MWNTLLLYSNSAANSLRLKVIHLCQFLCFFKSQFLQFHCVVSNVKSIKADKPDAIEEPWLLLGDSLFLCQAAACEQIQYVKNV